MVVDASVGHANDPLGEAYHCVHSMCCIGHLSETLFVHNLWMSISFEFVCLYVQFHILSVPFIRTSKQCMYCGEPYVCTPVEAVVVIMSGPHTWGRCVFAVCVYMCGARRV